MYMYINYTLIRIHTLTYTHSLSHTHTHTHVHYNRVKHRNIVELFELFDSKSKLYLVMEL